MADKTTIGRKQWEVTTLPDFKGKKALVLPGAFYGSAVQLMAACGFGRAASVDEADIVVFIGGVDVNPALYNQKKLSETQPPSEARDTLEIDVYKAALAKDIPMFGICRGAQFLHVMNGGALWQHVENHAGGNHKIYDIDDDVYLMANSYHHQMIQINNEIELIAVCEEQVSKVFKDENMFINLTKEGVNAEAELEIEAGAYTKTKCFFVQGHPEVGDPEYQSWCMHKLKDFVESYATWFTDDERPSDPDSDINQWIEAKKVVGDC